MEKYGQDPIHPILENSDEYQITCTTYRHYPENPADDYLDLVLQRRGTIRRLRFLEPTRLRMQEPLHSDILILNLRPRGWERINVEVVTVEPDGGISFYARDVVDLDTISPAETIS